MLILTRRIGEEILIDQGQIMIKVITMLDGVVAIGIHATRKIDIDRKELFLKKNPTWVNQHIDINGNVL